MHIYISGQNVHTVVYMVQCANSLSACIQYAPNAMYINIPETCDFEHCNINDLLNVPFKSTFENERQYLCIFDLQNV